MVSDAELIDRLREFLRNSDLNTTTNAIVRKQLEKDFAISLSDRKLFIREQVDLFLASLEKEDENNGESARGDEDDDNPVEICQSDGIEESNEEDREDEEEESVKKTAPKRSSKKDNSEPKKKGGGFSILCSLSPKLQEFYGVAELSRAEAVKQLWKYIKEKNLQDPSNKRNIICDESLRGIFKVDVIDMFQMNKALSKHIWPLESGHENRGSVGHHDDNPAEKAESEGIEGYQSKEEINEEDEEVEEEEEEEDEKEEEEEEEKEEEKETEKEKEEEVEEDEGEKERSAKKTVGNKRSKKDNNEPKKKGGGFSILCSLSPKLQEFYGVAELSRAEAVKQLWKYIKEKNLQDPSNKRNIICDESLRGIFKVDVINMFQMNKALSKHIWPLESGDENRENDLKKTNEEKNRGSVSRHDDNPAEKAESERIEGIEGYQSEEEINEEEEDNEEDEDEEKENEKEKEKEKEEGEEDEDEDEEEEDEEERTVKKTARNKRSKKDDNEPKRKGGGFSILCSLSPQLQEFYGVAELSRSEAVKQLWKYIKEKNLQDPSDKRNIICDEPLRTIFKVDAINMFQMNKALSKHIWPLESGDVTPVSSKDKEKQKRPDRIEVTLVKPKHEEKHQECEREEVTLVKPKREEKHQKYEREEVTPVKPKREEKHQKREREEGSAGQEKKNKQPKAERAN